MKIDKINESVERLVDLAKNNPEEAQSDISKQDVPYVIYYTNEKVIPVLNKNQTILNITHEGNVFKKIPYIEIANQPDESL